MYTYCDKGGAVVPVVLGYYMEGRWTAQDSRLRSWIGFSSTLLHTPTLKAKTTNMDCSTMKDPLHTTLNSIAIDPNCLPLLLPVFGFSAKRTQCSNYLL